MSDKEFSVSISTDQITVGQLAEMFMNLDSGEQAQFFRECGRIEHQWGVEAKERRDKGLGGFYVAGMQWLEIEKELAGERYDPHNGYDFVMHLSSFFWKHVFDYAYRTDR